MSQFFKSMMFLEIVDQDFIRILEPLYNSMKSLELQYKIELFKSSSPEVVEKARAKYEKAYHAYQSYFANKIFG
jgi:hypothetical protein